MRKDEIQDFIFNILKELFKIDEVYLCDRYIDIPLFEEPFEFSGIQMVYLVFEIEKHVGVRYREEALIKYESLTIEDLTAQLLGELENTGKSSD